MNAFLSSKRILPKVSRSALIVIFATLLVLSVNAFWWIFFEKTSKQFSQQLDARLKSLAISGSALFSAIDIDILVDGDIEVYLKALDFVNVLAAADSVSEVFVLDLNYSIIASSRIDSDSFYLLADLNRDALDAVFNLESDGSPGTGALVTKSYEIGDIILKSAFSPLFGDDGIPIAVLGVEADVNYSDTLSELKANLVLSSLVSGLAALVFATFFLFIQRKVTHAENSALRQQSEINLGRMVAVVSHEIKNPLTVLRSAAERIKKKTEMTEADFIIEEVDRLNKIVIGYLDLVRSPDRVQLQNVELEQVLMDLRELGGQLRPRFKSDNIVFTTIIPPVATAGAGFDTREILIDRAALRQIALNLILNAADAARSAKLQNTSEGDEAEVRLAVEISHDKFLLNVYDNGDGIPSSDQKHLFEPFYTTKQQGSGLGLFLCGKLVRKMNGDIRVESREGGPTKFTVVVPIKANHGERKLRGVDSIYNKIVSNTETSAAPDDLS